MTVSVDEDVAAVARIPVTDSMLEVICRTTGMGFAAVARVTGDRWIACAVRDEISFGLGVGGELEVATTICNEIRQHGEAVVIDYVAEDPTYCGHHTPARYGIQSYISVPIIHRGEFFGTLCAIDPSPAKVNTPEMVGMFKLFADLIAQHLDSQSRLEVSEASLLSERETAELREQFVAVLGHDLRNSLAAIQGGARLLQRTELSERAVTLIQMMHGSVNRMAALVDNVMDFARARLGGGLGLNRSIDPQLGEALEQVVGELRIVRPDQQIISQIALDQLVDCDRQRIAQVLSNLVGNAVTHGDAAGQVTVRAFTRDGVFEMSVENTGDPIPAAVQQKLFEPFTRAALSREGLGLGLYIASQIARAHEATLTVESGGGLTRFTFRMPLSL